MKRIIVAIAAAALLAGCSSDKYYSVLWMRTGSVTIYYKTKEACFAPEVDGETLSKNRDIPMIYVIKCAEVE